MTSSIKPIHIVGGGLAGSEAAWQLASAGVPYKIGKAIYFVNGRAKALDETEGFVKILAHKDTDRILGVHILGAGRDGNHGKIDYSVGVSEVKKVGTQVKQGEPLMMIHYNDEAKLEQALEYFKNAYRLAPKRPTPPPLIVERVA